MEEKAMPEIGTLTSPDLLTDEQIEALLPELDGIISWAKQVQDYALNQALSGKKYEGYKVVEGKSNRKWKDESKVADTLEVEGYDSDIIYEKKLKGISAMESLLGKKDFQRILGLLVEKPAGKPTLVPESDKRPAYNVTEQAAADFKD